jgi:hypothetical protein
MKAPAMTRTTLVAVLALIPGLTTEAAAQRRVRPEAPGASVEAVITIAGKIGGKNVQASGSGSCQHAPDASIRGVSASVWLVQFGASGEAALRQLNLTLWRLKDGSPDELSLTVETSSGEHQIESGADGKGKGEGTVTILPSGPGGRLELKGKDTAGKRIQLTIDCPAFSAVEAEGG